MSLKKSDFFFTLPEALIAQSPLAERDAGRLLVLEPARQCWTDARVTDLPSYLAPGDLLVFNDTRVLPARLLARKAASGGAVELLLDRLEGDRQAWFLARASKPLRPGVFLDLPGAAQAEVLEKDEMRVRLRLAEGDWLSLLEAHGAIPLPPYIQREADAEDAERYQTVYARNPGAVAAPTAGLHFDQDLLDRLRARGIHSAFITLHVGAGTFLPVRSELVSEHRMHGEIARVGDDVVAAVAATRARGGRVFAIGTTACRALEAAGASGELRPFQGETQIFLYPGKRFRVIDGLFTNFHLPESTLIMLVCALAGTAFTLQAYAHAVTEAYRFFSYGDAMLILPPAPGVQHV